jgi:hypothetical protein
MMSYCMRNAALTRACTKHAFEEVGLSSSSEKEAFLGRDSDSEPPSHPASDTRRRHALGGALDSQSEFYASYGIESRAEWARARKAHGLASSVMQAWLFQEQSESPFSSLSPVSLCISDLYTTWK